MSDQLKKCSHCGEEIMVGAKKCKHCSADLRNWFVRHKILTAILFLFVLGSILSAAGYDGEMPVNGSGVANNTDEESYIAVTAVELSRAYDNNKVAADAKYDGRLLEVSGIISDIGKDIMDDPYVSLKGIEMSLFGVQCMFPRSSESDLIDLSNGQNITLRGRLSGELIGNVILRSCSISK